jgi:cysteine desulfurase
MYAPKGIGALYIRSGADLEPIIHGGGQERGLRAGTENVALIAALGGAAQIAADELPASAARVTVLRDRLHDQLDRLLPGSIQLNGHPTHRLPGTLNLSIAGVNGKDLLAATPQIAASAGSACHEGTDAPSTVLTAMGLPTERARSAIRLTLGRWTTTHEVDHAARLLAAHAATLRQQAIASP